MGHRADFCAHFYVYLRGGEKMGLNAFYNTKLKHFVPDATSQFDSG